MAKVSVFINGLEFKVAKGSTILDAARQNGVYIPALCFHPDLPRVNMDPAGVIHQGKESIRHDNNESPYEPCGLCIVKLEGKAEPVRACVTQIEEGIRVTTEDEELKKIRRARLKHILESANHPSICITCDRKPRCDPFGVCVRSASVSKRCVACPEYPHCELLYIADSIGMTGVTLSYRDPGSDEIIDNLLFEFDPTLCIGCLRCVRVCNDLRGVGALGFVIHQNRIYVGTKSEDFLRSGCRYCLACVEICPTGALVDKSEKWKPISSQTQRISELVPCVNACPVGIDIPLYVYLISKKKYKEALEVIKQKLPFPLMCALVCTRPCEAVCRRKDLDEEAVAIRDLKRFAAENGDDDFEESVTVKSSNKRIAIIGSGPAGLSSAYLLRKFGGYSVTIFEALSEPGGIPLVAIPRFRLPKRVVQIEVGRVTKLGVTINLNRKVESVHELLCSGFDAVLIATGCHREIPLGIEGEQDTDSVIGALSFLRQVNMGNAPQLEGKSVAVIGGGNAAIDAARTCVRLSAKDVVIVYRRSREQMPADEREIRITKEEGVKFLFQAVPVTIVDSNSGVTLVCLETRLRGRGRDGRPRVFPVRGTEFELNVDLVITAVGQKAVVPKDMAKDMSRKGVLTAQGESLMTSLTGVFAAGDVVTGPSSIISAIAMGKKAAESIDRYLGGSGVLEDQVKPYASIPHRLEPSEDFFKPRFEAPVLPSSERIRNFDLVEQAYPTDVAAREAHRCLKCSLRSTIWHFEIPRESGQ